MVMGSAGTIGSSLGGEEITGAFWISDKNYQVYDDFTSETIDAGRWTSSGTGTIAADNGSESGSTSGWQMLMVSNASSTVAVTEEVISNAMPNNKKAYHCKIYILNTSDGNSSKAVAEGSVKFNGVYYSLGQDDIGNSASVSYTTAVLWIKTANNTYDMYIGGVKKVAGVVIADFEIGFKCYANEDGGQNRVCTFYVGDVVYQN
jgi:hypothetical protein